MKSHPVEQIISNLPEEHHRLFSKQLLKGSRSEKIYITLRDWPGLSKEKIFRKVFKADYVAEQDYLLRNELSLLRKKLEAFLVEQYELGQAEIQQAYRDYVLAKVYLDLQLFKLSREKLLKSQKVAKVHEDWNLLVKLNLLQSSLTILNTVELKEKIDLLNNRIADHTLYAGNFYFSELSFAGYLGGISDKMKKIENGGKDESREMVPLRENATQMESYFFFKGIAYGKGGIGSVPYLEAALTYLETLPSTPDRVNEWFSCTGQIASEYSAAGNLFLAEKWFDRIIRSAELEKYPKKNFLILNYITTLVKLKKYKEALKRISETESASQEVFVIERLKMLRISCYIFTKDTRNLKRILPKDFSNMDTDVRHYYRMQYSIYFYLCGNIESAEREMQNLQRNSSMQTKGYTGLVSLFLSFYTFMMTFPGGKAPKEKRNRLNRLFDDFISAESDQLKNTVPALWLVSEWENLKKD